MKELYKKLLAQIGEDPKREGLAQTPRRAWETFRFLTSGYGENLEDLIGDAVFSSDVTDMVLVKDIELYSMCEHHLLPFFGKAHVAYLPDGKVIGISKLARIVDHYARRLQVQENLTKQVANTVQEYTGALGVAVVIEAQHLCMMMRGVQKQNSIVTTSAVLGEFHDDASTRAEFFSLIGR